MAQKQIAARIMGDDYQGRFFWFQAAQLLFDRPLVESVVLEHDEVAHVDDVAVYYHSPGKKEGVRYCTAEFYQVKYHMDQRSAYCADGFKDPTFINSTSTSLLQRFFKAHTLQRDQLPWFTLNLVSNWVWQSDDHLAKAIRQDGALPDVFFSTSRETRLGRIRQAWIEHLGIDEETFTDFGRRLRLKLNYFGTADFNAALSDRLFRAGLQPTDSSVLASRYDDLARKFITTSQTDFDQKTFRAMCESEGLIRAEPEKRTVRTIGIRSFIPFAENIESDCDEFVCVSDHFDGRHPRTADAWQRSAASVREFLATERPHLIEDHRLLLDCHLSFALAAGYLLTTRAPVFPAGPRPRLEIQRPQMGADTNQDGLWESEMFDIDPQTSDLAVAVSVTHKVSPQVLDYLQAQGLPTSQLLEVSPVNGIGRSSVRDADYATALATSFVGTVRSHLGAGRRIHLFTSAPNFLAFFIGQQARALGEVVLYEYGFDGPEPRSYNPSLVLPL